MAKKQLEIKLDELKQFVQQKINEDYVPYRSWKRYDKEKRNSIHEAIGAKYNVDNATAHTIMRHPDIKELLKQIKRSHSRKVSIIFV